MMRRELTGVDPIKWSGSKKRTYDGLLCTVGYESRARHFAEKKKFEARHSWALGFDNRKVLMYPDNLYWYSKSGFKVSEPSDTQFIDAFLEFLRASLDGDDDTRTLCIDISSLTRLRLAVIVDSIRNFGGNFPLVVDFVYSPAKFSPPPSSSGPNQAVRPLPGFAGWTNDPSLPHTVVVGVGYERNKAIGAVRYLDPESVWAFIPSEHTHKYATAIEKANGHLWDLISPDKRIYYSVIRPFDCLATLESFTRGALRTNKVTFVPFGPKLFALTSLLVACVHTDVAVWRVSAGEWGEPIDRKPNGEVIGLKVVFQPN